MKKEQRRLNGEVDRIKTDNARLVKMLSSTREYSEFVQRAYAQSDVAYVKHGTPLVDLRIVTEDYTTEGLEGDRPLGDPKSEFAHWMPADVFRYAQECRTRYLPAVPEECFGNFIHAMHQRWRAHENRVLNKREVVHDREKQDMYRQVAHRKPHDVTTLEAQVRHLRGQLRNAQRGSSTAVATAGDNDAKRSKEKLLEWSLNTVSTTGVTAK